MAPLARIGNILADYIDRRSGHRFTNHKTSTAPNPPGQPSTPGTGTASTPVLPGTARPSPEHPAGSGLAGPTAENCTATQPHICVNETGQPSTTVCIASWYRQHRLPTQPKEVA